jgi:hypothetical protein
MPKQVRDLAPTNRVDPCDEFLLARGSAGMVRPKNLKKTGLNDVVCPLTPPAIPQSSVDHAGEDQTGMFEQRDESCGVAAPCREQCVIRTRGGISRPRRFGRVSSA